MIAAEPTFNRIALNRVTFGARDVDVQFVDAIGWEAYVEAQLAAPAGDDPALSAHLASQTMPIKYPAGDFEDPDLGWPAIDEDRPLAFLDADTATLWNLAIAAVQNKASFMELARVQQEISAATWIRAAHAEYQIREFMVDFWNNHFSIGREDDLLGSATLPVYDRDHIRPHVFGNFREMLEANATSTAMLQYLDNASSVAELPNENYARELLELHTMGEDAYLGVKTPPSEKLIPPVGVDAPGFSDDDIIQASRALSGWTLQFGQRHPTSFFLPNTGEFVYNPFQHNTDAGFFMGVDLTGKTGDMEQGRAVLDVAAYHPATAHFICTKICRRIFGDPIPEAVLDRAIEAWMANQEASDQIAQVMRAILLDGPEIGEGTSNKYRRPFERLIALMRTTDMVVNANSLMAYALEPMLDGLYTWPAPNGRPDVNGYWLTTSTTLQTWNLAVVVPFLSSNGTSLVNQTPQSALTSAIELVEYWVGRMVGYELAPETMNALIEDASGPTGAINIIAFGTPAQAEMTLRRLVSMIATTTEFSFR